MREYETLRAFEDMDEQGQFDEIRDKWLNNKEIFESYKRHSRPDNEKSSAGVLDTFYYRKNEDGVIPEVDENEKRFERLAVFCVMDKEIKGQENQQNYTFLDKSIYLLIKKENDVSLNYTLSGDIRRINVSGKKFMLLHQLAFFPNFENEAIDHISCNPRINVKNLLRQCSRQDNNKNKRIVHYTKIRKNHRAFEMTVARYKKYLERLRLEGISDGRQYKVLKSKVISETFESEQEVYAEMGRVENMLMGEYRYNPFLDFTETWYVVFFWKVLGIINKEDVKEYQRMYWIKKYQNAKTEDEIEEYGEILRRYMYEDYERVKR